MFEFSGTSYLRKRRAFKNLRFGRRLAFLLSGKPKKHGFMSFRNEGGYGKNNRILYTGEISENSKVGSGASTQKGDRVPLEHNEVNPGRARHRRRERTVESQQGSVGVWCTFVFTGSTTLNCIEYSESLGPLGYTAPNPRICNRSRAAAEAYVSERSTQKTMRVLAIDLGRILNLTTAQIDGRLFPAVVSASANL
jgi:hypothetical protein